MVLEWMESITKMSSNQAALVTATGSQMVCPSTRFIAVPDGEYSEYTNRFYPIAKQR